jgi:uncharacterized membrane protein YbaN (DUF454 family)
MSTVQAPKIQASKSQMPKDQAPTAQESTVQILTAQVPTLLFSNPSIQQKGTEMTEMQNASALQAEQVSLGKQTDDTTDAYSKKLVFRTIKRALFAVFGFLFFGLGAVGAFLPLLPTTPFLLLSVACFSRSSERFDNWIKNTRLYKQHLESFIQDHSMPLKTKIALCAFASIMLVTTFILSDNLYVRILIAALIIFKYYYFIFRIRTKKD